MSAAEQLPPVAPSDGGSAGGSAGGSSIDELQVRLTSLGGTVVTMFHRAFFGINWTS